LIPAAACLKATAVGAAVVFEAIAAKTKPVSLRTSVVAAIHVKPTEAEVEYVGLGTTFLTVRSGTTFLKPAPLFALNVVLIVVRMAVVLRRVWRFVMTRSVTVWSG